MNSHRDNVKDAIYDKLGIYVSEGDADELKYDIADAVFDALGITEDEQDKCGGYWMLHANKDEKKFVAPKPRDEDGCLITLSDDLGEFTDDTMRTSLAPQSEYVQMSPEEEAEHNNRVKELAAGTSRYTFEEFRRDAKEKQSYPENQNDWYIYIITPVCRYGQNYTKLMSLEHAKQKFADFYYPMYLEDCERSDKIGEVDNDKI